MKKTLLVILVVILVGATILYSQRSKVAMAVIERAAPRLMLADIRTNLEDGLHIALCGAGSPLADPKRSGPCAAVIAGQSIFIVDSGTGGARNLGPMQIPIGEVDSVFLTHFHSDHIDGLGELATLRWVNAANTEPMIVRGPTGVEDIVDGFNEAYERDSVYRFEHHGDTVAPLSGHGMVAEAYQVPEFGQAITVYTKGPLRVEMFRVEHDPVSPAVGYRFTYKDRVMVISGDTSKSDNVLEFSRGADLLVHEALAAHIVMAMNRAAERINRPIMAKVTFDILDYHATPVEAAETARDAGVDHLLFNHIVPALVLPGLEAAWLEGVADVFPDYTLGQDGTFISLPAGSDEVILVADSL